MTLRPGYNQFAGFTGDRRAQNLPQSLPNGLEVRYVHDTLDEGLMAQTYEDVFYKIWPEYDPRNPENTITDTYDYVFDRMVQKPDDWRPFFMVVGKNLDDPEKREIVGMIYSQYFLESQSFYIGHIAVLPEHRSYGTAHYMRELGNQAMSSFAEQLGHKIKGAYFEIHNPETISSDQDNAMDPRLRKALFERWGAREIGGAEGIKFPYIQPSWGPGLPQYDGFILMSYAVDGEYPEAESVKRYLRDYYSKYGEKSDAEIDSNGPFNNMMAALDEIAGVQALMRPPAPRPDHVDQGSAPPVQPS